MIPTLKGRCIGVLISDETDAASLAALKAAAQKAEATLKVVAPRRGGVQLDNGKWELADGQLAGTPSVFFDAVAVLLSASAAKALAKEAAAVDWVRDAFGHLKAIGVDEGGHALLTAAGLPEDGAIVDISDTKAFLACAATRHWKREPAVRTLP